MMLSICGGARTISCPMLFPLEGSRYTKKGGQMEETNSSNNNDIDKVIQHAHICARINGIDLLSTLMHAFTLY